VIGTLVNDDVNSFPASTLVIQERHHRESVAVDFEPAAFGPSSLLFMRLRLGRPDRTEHEAFDHVAAFATRQAARAADALARAEATVKRQL
jgi:hypothetical protein